jgi:hypothetical protein
MRLPSEKTCRIGSVANIARKIVESMALAGIAVAFTRKGIAHVYHLHCTGRGLDRRAAASGRRRPISRNMAGSDNGTDFGDRSHPSYGSGFSMAAARGLAGLTLGDCR